MNSYRRNILGICALSLLIIGGFMILTAGTPMTNQPVVAQNMTSLQAVCSTTASSDSNWVVILGIAGLIYLKIIWKLIHAPNMFDK